MISSQLLAPAMRSTLFSCDFPTLFARRFLSREENETEAKSSELFLDDFILLDEMFWNVWSKAIVFKNSGKILETPREKCERSTLLNRLRNIASSNGKKNKKCLNLSLTMASTESTGDDVFNEIRGFEKTRWVYIWLICALINKRWLPPADSQSQEGIQCIYSPCAMLICTFCKFCLFTFREEKMWRMFWVAASESDFRCWTF